MKVWLRGKWLKIRVSVIALIAFIAGVANTYAYVQYLDLQANVGTTYIQINGAVAPAASQVKEDIKAEAGETQPSADLSVSEIADRIYVLESSGGKNDSCRLKGMWNGYGYMQNTYYNECFSSQEEVRGLVEGWIQDKLDKNYKTAELACFYNKGIKTDSCEYANKFFSL